MEPPRFNLCIKCQVNKSHNRVIDGGAAQDYERHISWPNNPGG